MYIVHRLIRLCVHHREREVEHARDGSRPAVFQVHVLDPRAARRARLVVCAAPSPRSHSTKLNRHGASSTPLVLQSSRLPVLGRTVARAHGIMLHSMGGFLWDRACLCARPCPVAVLLVLLVLGIRSRDCGPCTYTYRPCPCPCLSLRLRPSPPSFHCPNLVYQRLGHARGEPATAPQDPESS